MNLFEKYKDSTINPCDIKTLTDEVAKLIMPNKEKLVDEEKFERAGNWFLENMRYTAINIYNNFNEYNGIETQDISYAYKHFFSPRVAPACVVRNTLVYIIAYIVKKHEYADDLFGIAMMRLYIFLKESLCERYNELKGE